jgi:type IV secretion system protein VirD4
MEPAVQDSVRALALRGDIDAAIGAWQDATGQDDVEAVRSLQMLLQIPPQPRAPAATTDPSARSGRATFYRTGQIWLGRSEDPSRGIGYGDDRHMVTIAGNRSGKGTSSIIPNLIEYPGSVICIDPKGENAAVTAMRRGPGSAYAQGMGQQVVVLDPFGITSGLDSALGSLNPLDLVDLENDGHDMAKSIAEAFVLGDDEKEVHWLDSAKQTIAALIVFIKAEVRPEEQNLATLRYYLTRGTPPEADEGAPPGTSGFDWMLVKHLRKCEACGGVVAAQAETLLSMGAEERGSVLSCARRNTGFLDSPKMQKIVEKSTFSLADLKQAARGMTLYLCLPQREMEKHGRWLRLLVLLGLIEMERLGHEPPATGSPVLFILDEFPTLGYLRPIESAAGYIAGYGVKLWVILQDLQQLMRHYPKSWSTFLANAGVMQAFCNSDQITLEYLTKRLGHKEQARYTHTSSESRSQTRGSSVSETQTQGTSTTRSSDLTLNREPRGWIFKGKRTGESTSKGVQTSREAGTSRGTSTEQSETGGHESGISVTTEVVPLMRPEEIERLFNDETQQSLILIAGAQPFPLTRTRYYEDRQFECKFDPHPGYQRTAPLPLAAKNQRAQEALSVRLESALEQRRISSEKPRSRATNGAGGFSWKASLAVGVCLAGALLVARLREKTPEPPAPAPIAVKRAAAPALGRTDLSSPIPGYVSPDPGSANARGAKAATTGAAAAAKQTTSLTVAAVGANLRAQPEAGAPVSVVSRGDFLQVVQSSGDFHAVRTESGQEGWIADRLVFPSEHYQRLKNVSAGDYIQANRPRLLSAIDQLGSMGNDLEAATRSIATDPIGALRGFADFDAKSRVKIAEDQAAARWFGRLAEYEQKSGRLDHARQLSLAAWHADPLDVEHMHRFLLLNYELGDMERIKVLAIGSVMIAPRSTNSWMLMGMSDALQGRDASAVGSFKLAIHVSQKEHNTRRYLQNLADSTGEAQIATAIRQALR